MRKVLSIVAAFMAATFMLSNTAGIANAQSRGLGITPRKDLVIQAGSSRTDQVSVSNLSTTQQLSLTLQVIDFGAQDESGTPALHLDSKAAQTPWSLRPFLKAPETLTVAPGKTEVVKFTVTIPKDQGAGSYYSAIRYAAQADEPGQVAIGASGATLVFVTVPGKTKESLVPQKFGAYVSKPGGINGSYKSFFVSSKPKELAFTLKNQGNVAEQPAGSIMIKNMFGKRVSIIEDANPKASLALIGQERRFQTCIIKQSDTDTTCKDTSLAPGRYTAALSLFYGINGNQTQDIEVSTSFWYLPVWFLIVTGVVLLAVVATVYILYRKITGKGSFKRR